MEKSTTSSAPFIRFSLTTETKILFPRMSFRVKIADVDKSILPIFKNMCRWIIHA